MKADEFRIKLHDSDGPEYWRIVAPKLKLALKYGLCRSDWTPNNRSIAYDRYTESRGPAAGLPTVADMAVTTLMNSGVSGDDLSTLHSWLQEEKPQENLRDLRETLLLSDGLCDMKHAALSQLAGVVNDALQHGAPDQDGRWRRRLWGIGSAKFFKWLATWAPHHVPMFDSYVYKAMTGKTQPTGNATVLLALQRFQLLVQGYHEPLTRLGSWVADRSEGKLTVPLSPVRVLDSLIWFDWMLDPWFWVEWEGKDIRDAPFHGFIDYRRRTDCYAATAAGERWMKEHGVDAHAETYKAGPAPATTGRTEQAAGPAQAESGGERTPGTSRTRGSCDGAGGVAVEGLTAGGVRPFSPAGYAASQATTGSRNLSATRCKQPPRDLSGGPQGRPR